MPNFSRHWSCWPNSTSEQRRVKLDFRGDGNRRVAVGYIQEAPVWKTSYRLVLTDDASALPAGMGDCRKHDRTRLERCATDPGQRKADFLSDGPLSAAVYRHGRS